LVRLPTELGDSFFRPQEGLRGKVAQRQDHLGLDRAQLRQEKRLAGGDFVGLGIAVPFRVALDHVTDVAILLTVEADRGEHLRQQLARPSDERQALPVLLLPRSLADADKLRPPVPGAEDDGASAPRELASRAPLELGFLSDKVLVRRSQVVSRQGQVPHAHGLPEAERVGQRPKGSGQRVRRHDLDSSEGGSAPLPSLPREGWRGQSPRSERTTSEVGGSLTGLRHHSERT
jgi:hypothetical protein